MGFLSGLGEGLAALGKGAVNTISGLGTGIGDFIGLDGQFGLGGANKAFSLSNLGDAISNAFDFGGDVTKNNGMNPAALHRTLGIGSYGVDSASLGNTKIADLTTNQFKNLMNQKSQGLAGMGFKDWAKMGGDLYSTYTGTKLAKHQIANQDKLMQNYFDRQHKADEDRDEYNKRIHDAYQQSIQG